MTITLQAVNELIASLETAGELSIKETKVMALAKAYLDVAAENVALKAAISAVNRTAEECELNGDELKYAVEPSEFEALTDLLDETPATDRIVAEAEARGVDKLAMRRRAAAKVALDEFNDVKNHAELESEAWRAEMFAAELREGAK
nr:MAG TPA_asm: hypothetical protein [Caudoviricetes sp.]